MISLILATTLLLTSPQAGADKGPVYVEAKEWNKQHPDLPKWKLYPSTTVRSLKGMPRKPDRLNRYGSLKDGPVFEATGFYRTQKYGDRWIMVDPEGHIHIDALVVGIRCGGGETNKKAFSEKFGTKEKWISETASLLFSNGFNGAGTWSDDTAIKEYNSTTSGSLISYCPIINVMSSYGKMKGVTRQLSGNTGYPNQCIPVFDPGFESFCDSKVADFVARYKGDPNVTGYFSDNELPISKKNLEGYLNLPDEDPGHIAAARWLEARGTDRSGITDDLRDEFAGYVAEKYYSTVSKALKKHDPDHMYIGSRLHGAAKYIRQVYEAAGRWCDMISINFYGFWNVRDKDSERWESWADKPFIITEFYTKAEDSGLTNTTGAGWLVHDQKSRGIHYENFIINLLRTNNCVGWSWFKYQDNDPTAKNVDPSNLNSNKGCVNNSYEPYGDLVSSMRKVNTIRYSIAGLNH